MDAWNNERLLAHKISQHTISNTEQGSPWTNQEAGHQPWRSFLTSCSGANGSHPDLWFGKKATSCSLVPVVPVVGRFWMILGSSKKSVVFVHRDISNRCDSGVLQQMLLTYDSWRFFLFFLKVRLAFYCYSHCSVTLPHMFWSALTTSPWKKWCQLNTSWNIWWQSPRKRLTVLL